MREISPVSRAVFTKTTPEIIPPLINNFRGNAVVMGCGYFRTTDGENIDYERVKEWVTCTGLSCKL